MGWVTDWNAKAACRTTDPDDLFVQGAAQNRAKAVCGACPVRAECLADALDSRAEFGVWGGMTERERRALLRRRPTVTSWRRLLATAKAEYEGTDTAATPHGTGTGAGTGAGAGGQGAAARPEPGRPVPPAVTHLTSRHAPERLAS
ncbi:WhiB family transcriptional regulator [Streptomyces otsuchiensis]|uniref:WhiB family transcriptional regulator n=1 Tax=Streptomyces otsuchiensis TaxID=2681388 RepID=UPI001031D646|nr:WhiB family transcriptional regulator [Streptomyces otsuchiensis]